VGPTCDRGEPRRRGRHGGTRTGREVAGRRLHTAENTSAQAYSAALSKNLPYDPLKDFIPVASLTNQPYVLVAGKLPGITSGRELIAAAKAKPGEL